MTLIKHQISTLRLRESAPYPSEVESAQQMIRRWRNEQRRLSGLDLARSDRGADGFVAPLDEHGED